MVDIERANTGLIICVGEDEQYGKMLSDKILQAVTSPDGRSVKLALLEVLIQKGILPRKYALKAIEIRELRSSNNEDSWIEIRCPFVDAHSMSKADIIALRVYDDNYNLHVEADPKAFYDSFAYILKCVEDKDKDLYVNGITEPVIVRYSKPE